MVYTLMGVLNILISWPAGPQCNIKHSANTLVQTFIVSLHDKNTYQTLVWDMKHDVWGMPGTLVGGRHGTCALPCEMVVEQAHDTVTTRMPSTLDSQHLT